MVAYEIHNLEVAGSNPAPTISQRNSPACLVKSNSKDALTFFTHFQRLNAMPPAVTFDLKSLFSRTSMLRVVAVVLAVAGAWGGMGTVPKMASASGAPVNDVLNTVLPFLGAGFAWIWSNWSKVSPEMVSAIVALARNPQDPTAWLRVTAGLIMFLKSVNPNSKALNTLVQFSRELHDEMLVSRPVPIPMTLQEFMQPPMSRQQFMPDVTSELWRKDARAADQVTGQTGQAGQTGVSG